MHKVSGLVFIMVKRAVKHSIKRKRKKERKKRESESDIHHAVEDFTRILEDICVSLVRRSGGADLILHSYIFPGFRPNALFS